MAAPTASASLNKSAYAPGEVITLTIDHADADRTSFVVAGTVTDSTGLVANWTATANVDDGVVAITSSGGKTWTVQSATRNRTVFTATA